VARLDLNVDDKLEKKFRATVYKRKGMKKGNITKSVEEAFVLWIDTGGEKPTE